MHVESLVDRCFSVCTFSFGHCVVCPSSIYGFWLPRWYLRFTDSDYPVGILDLRILISCSTSDTRRVNLVTNPMISHERGKDREVLTTSNLWHRYSIASTKSWWRPYNFPSDDFNLAKRNPWFSTFLVRTMQKMHDEQHGPHQKNPGWTQVLA
jgi:hypothetical protein